MKKFLLLSFTAFSFLTAGCSFQEYVHTTEPRSTIYIGQTAADVYENFGKPTKIERLGENKQILIYHKQEIEKDWSYRYFHECKLKFYMVDDRLEDWTKEGDMCAVKELSSDIEHPYFNLLDEKNASYNEQQEVSGSILPLDAFRDSSEPKEKSFFSGWFSDEPEEEFLDSQEPSYVTEKQNRVFIGNGLLSGSEYQMNEASYYDIPADAF